MDTAGRDLQVREAEVKGHEIKLGDTLSYLIEREGYSRNRRPILDALGISPAALSQYTRDQSRPSLQNLVALAAFFNVTLDYLVYGEPTGTAVDHGPLARYVEHALNDIQAKASRHSDLVARLGRLLAEGIDATATRLETSAGAGLVLDDEIQRLERHCVHADIMPLNLAFNVISMDDGDAAPGQFLQVVAENLGKGCTYRFLLPGRPGEHTDVVNRFESLLSKRIGRDYVRQNCVFRRTDQPVLAGAAIYRLDLEGLNAQEPMLYEQFSSYVDEEGRLGYVVRPNNESNADMLVSRAQLGRVEEAFETLWAGAGRL
ncbi:helix-turn-helix transcriptional regulator [Lentzea sp. NBRC 105346]|uniref:helix-turn-helix domain-containing protein n=1 Tax=Lentzea sp. NBRC 105346 TaxID=3032205 RepID=UPI002552E6EF|nr:helix-turn-helix transcriptional regulator [Lentzea sp. NBRC 105346]